MQSFPQWTIHRMTTRRAFAVGLFLFLLQSLAPQVGSCQPNTARPQETTQPPAPTSSEWPFVRAAGPFVFRASAAMKEFDAVTADLEQIHKDLTQFLKLPPVRQRVEVYLFEDKTTFRQFLEARFPQAPFRRALYIKEGDGPGIVLAYINPDWREDLRHEGTHALMHAALPMVPLWLDEGLAEYFEMPAERRAHGHSHQTLARWGANFRVGANLRKLEDMTDIQQMGTTEYRNSWAWIHFLLHGDLTGYEELVSHVKRIASSEPPGRLSDRLYRRVPDLNARFSIHFRTWK